MSCFPEMYEKKGIKGHRSCASNIAYVVLTCRLEERYLLTLPM